MELFRALGMLAEGAGPEQVRLAALLGLPEGPDPATFTDLFVLQLYPYASVYLGAEGMLGGEARDRVAGFWRALGRTPPADPDHLTALLALYAAQSEREGAETDPARRVLAAEGRRALLWEHLLPWLPPYLEKVEELAPACYRAWGALLGEALRTEAASFALPERLPLHLRDAPPLPDPREAGADAFLRGLLAPVRSGMVLARADLARGAREAGLGLRAGERRFILEALLGQDAPRVLAWLAAEAGAWTSRHRRWAETTGPIAAFWEARAARAASLLASLDGG